MLDLKKCQSAGQLFQLLFVVFDHSIMLLSDWRECLYTFRSQKKKGRKNFCETRTKLFPTALPFFPPATGVRAKHAKPLSAMLECSKIKQRERRSINKCPVTFLQIEFFRHPQIA
nr:DNA repair protein RadC [Enterococcus casseliflavus]